MGIQRLQPQVQRGTAFSEYTPFRYGMGVTIDTAGQYHTGLSINGEGYLSHATIAGSGSQSGMKITIDGVVVFETYGTGSSSDSGGIIQDNNMSHTSSTNFQSDNMGFAYSQIKPHPFISSSAKGVVPLPQPLFFKKSLLIEVKAATAGYNPALAVKGGIK